MTLSGPKTPIMGVTSIKINSYPLIFSGLDEIVQLSSRAVFLTMRHIIKVNIGNHIIEYRMHEQSSNCLFGKILRDPSDRRCRNRPIPELENDEEGIVADEYGRTWLALFVGGGTQLSQVHHRNHLCAAWKPSNPQCCDTPFREFNRSLDAGGDLYVSCCYKARYTIPQ